MDLDGRRIDFRLVNEGDEQGAARTRQRGGSRTAWRHNGGCAGKPRGTRRRSATAQHGAWVRWRRKGTGKSTQKAMLLTKAQEPGKASRQGRSSRRSWMLRNE